jgi:hypothetical protein
MEESRVELSIGESVQLNDQILTVVDINDDEIIFRIEAVDESAILTDPFGETDGDQTWMRRSPR